MSIAFDASANPFDSEVYTEAKPTTTRNKFSPEVADRLLDKLASDDSFRALFLAEPRAALRLVGHETPTSDLGVEGADPIMCCLGIKSLASKEALQASRHRLSDRLSNRPFHYAIEL